MRSLRTYFFHAGLFALTFITATLAGVNWANRDPYALENFVYGVEYSVLLLIVLGAHELGHYIAARIKGIKSTLPYFIPLPPLLGAIHFGTLGAVIKLQAPLRSRKEIFDIGAAGPIAGFVVSTIILIVGFSTLPPVEYLYTFHPEYAQMQILPTDGPVFGNTLFFKFVGYLFAPERAFVPPMNEVYHYPLLCVGWFGLFVTAMNLIPIGQLDGGHIVYAMLGQRAQLVGKIAFALLLMLGVGDLLPLVGIPYHYGWSGWLFWAVILFVFTRGLRGRTPLEDEQPIDKVRLWVGWGVITIFLASFAISPFTFTLP